ncbi:hypothetical protein HDV62DRAFT_351848 [Trichoderma sp. SZMC 28011]
MREMRKKGLCFFFLLIIIMLCYPLLCLLLWYIEAVRVLALLLCSLVVSRMLQGGTFWNWYFWHKHVSPHLMCLFCHRDGTMTCSPSTAMSLVTDNQSAASCNFCLCGLMCKKRRIAICNGRMRLAGGLLECAITGYFDGQMHVSCGSQGGLANLKSWDEPGGRKKWEKIGSYST